MDCDPKYVAIFSRKCGLNKRLYRVRRFMCLALSENALCVCVVFFM
jgi:hypothetical protein